MKQVPHVHEQNLLLSLEMGCTSMPDGHEFQGTFFLPSSHAPGREDFPDSSPQPGSYPRQKKCLALYTQFNMPSYNDVFQCPSLATDHGLAKGKNQQMRQVGLQDTHDLGWVPNLQASPLRNAGLNERDTPQAGSRQRGFVGETSQEELSWTRRPGEGLEEGGSASLSARPPQPELSGTSITGGCSQDAAEVSFSPNAGKLLQKRTS